MVNPSAHFPWELAESLGVPTSRPKNFDLKSPQHQQVLDKFYRDTAKVLRSPAFNGFLATIPDERLWEVFRVAYEEAKKSPGPITAEGEKRIAESAAALDAKCAPTIPRKIPVLAHTKLCSECHGKGKPTEFPFDIEDPAEWSKALNNRKTVESALVLLKKTKGRLDDGDMPPTDSEQHSRVEETAKFKKAIEEILRSYK